MTGSDLQALMDAQGVKPTDLATEFGVPLATVYRLLQKGDSPLPAPWPHALAAWKSGLQPL